MNELSILKELDHPDIIRLYEWFEDEEYLFFVTEYICCYLVFAKVDSYLTILKKSVFFLKMRQDKFLAKC